MKKLYTFIFVLAFFTFALELVNIHLSGKLASDGITVRKIQERIDVIEEKNHILNSKVLSLTSFETISSKAGALGFVPTTSYLSLKDQTKLSLKR